MLKKYYTKQKLERLLGLTALLILTAVSILGLKRDANDIDPYLHQLMDAGQEVEALSNHSFKVSYSDEAFASGYIAFGESKGYGGPLKLAVFMDTNTIIRRLVIINHNETPSYVEKVKDQKFYWQLINKNYQHAFKLDDDLDAVSGATYTSEAIAEACKMACYTIAKEQKGIVLPELTKPSIKFGLPEILLILLYALSLWGIYYQLKWKKALRWIVMVVGLLALGFWFSVPLSLIKINSILIGYWPQWHSSLYWYLLIGGGLITLISTNKRVYCNWICPFGASQSCLGLIGGSKIIIKGKFKTVVKWAQRAIAFLAIATALYFRNPGTLNYEIFGTFFNMTGTSILFGITGIYVLTSMFIKRPYCNTLCPITPIEEFILMLKKWLVSGIRTKTNTAKPSFMHQQALKKSIS